MLFRSVLVRDNDVFQHVKEKAEIVNNANADLFISFHANQSTKELENKASGIEFFTVSKEKDNGFKTPSDVLANYTNSYVSQAVFKTNGLRSRQIGIWFLQATKCPGMLIETGFMTNKKDLKILKDEEKRKGICVQVLNALGNYLFEMENSKHEEPLSSEDINTTVKVTAKILNDENVYNNPNKKDTISAKDDKNRFAAMIVGNEIMPFKDNVNYIVNGYRGDSSLTKQEVLDWFHNEGIKNSLSDIEMKEYNTLLAKTVTADEDKKYDIKKLSKDEKNKMIELYEKMNEEQKANAPLKTKQPIIPNYVLASPTTALWNEWKNNPNITVNIDNHSQDKSIFFNTYKADFFKSYFIRQMFYHPSKIGRAHV